MTTTAIAAIKSCGLCDCEIIMELHTEIFLPSWNVLTGCQFFTHYNIWNRQCTQETSQFLATDEA